MSCPPHSSIRSFEPSIRVLSGALIVTLLVGCADSPPTATIPDPDPLVWSYPRQLATPPGVWIAPQELIAVGDELFLLTAQRVGNELAELYLYRGVGPNWSAPETWAGPELVAGDEPAMSNPGFTRDAEGRLHFIWMAHESVGPEQPAWSPRVRYRSWSGGEWSAAGTLHQTSGTVPVFPSSTWPPGIVDPPSFVAAGTDREGRAHLAFEELAEGDDATGTSVRLLVQDGTSWNAQRVPTDGRFLDPSFSTGGTSDFALAYRSIGPSRVATLELREGRWEPGATLPGTAYGPRMAIESGGRRHLLRLRGQGQISHVTSEDGTAWSAAADLAVPTTARDLMRLVIDRDDRLHVIYTGPLATGRFRPPPYYLGFEAGVWSFFRRLPASEFGLRDLVIAYDGVSRLHAMWNSGSLYHSFLELGETSR